MRADRQSEAAGGFNDMATQARVEAGKKPPLKILSYAEMVALPEPEWLVEGIIQKRTAALIFGKSNSFKTFIGIDLGCSVAIGQPWHGNQVSQGQTIFVATEGANGIGRLRIPAWFDHYEIERSRRDNVHLFPKEIRLDVAADVSALIEAMHSLGQFGLVNLDIFGGTMAGSEIEDKTARAWVHNVQRIIRETGATVLAIAHTGWNDETRARMHTHFWGSFDSRLRQEGDKDKLTACLTIERHKDADSTGAWGFRMERAGDSLVPVLDATVKLSKTRSLSAQQQIALDALDDALQAHGVRKLGQDWPPCPVVAVHHWRTWCDRHSLAASDKPDSRLKAFKRARAELQKRKLIRIFDDHVWRCFDD
jgi:hypothetical protein